MKNKKIVKIVIFICFIAIAVFSTFLVVRSLQNNNSLEVRFKTGDEVMKELNADNYFLKQNLYSEVEKRIMSETRIEELEVLEKKKDSIINKHKRDAAYYEAQYNRINSKLNNYIDSINRAGTEQGDFSERKRGRGYPAKKD